MLRSKTSRNPTRSSKIPQREGTKTKSPSLRSPKTPGWKTATADMFREPIATPSPLKSRRMTRRTSVMVKKSSKGKATSWEIAIQNEDVIAKKPRRQTVLARPKAMPSKTVSNSRQTVFAKPNKPLSPALTRAKRRASVYMKPGSPQFGKVWHTPIVKRIPTEAPSQLALVEENTSSPMKTPPMKRVTRARTNNISNTSKLDIADDFLNRKISSRDRKTPEHTPSEKPQMKTSQSQSKSHLNEATNESPLKRPRSKSRSPRKRARSVRTTSPRKSVTKRRSKTKSPTKASSEKSSPNKSLLMKTPLKPHINKLPSGRKSVKKSVRKSATTKNFHENSFSNEILVTPHFVSSPTQKTKVASKSGKSQMKISQSQSKSPLNEETNESPFKKSVKRRRSKSRSPRKRARSVRTTSPRKSVTKRRSKTKSPTKASSEKSSPNKSLLMKTPLKPHINKLPSGRKSVKKSVRKSATTKNFHENSFSNEIFATPKTILSPTQKNKVASKSEMSRQTKSQKTFVKKIKISSPKVFQADASMQVSFATPLASPPTTRNSLSKSYKKELKPQMSTPVKAAIILRKTTRDTPRKAVRILGKTTPTPKPIKRKKTPGRQGPDSSTPLERSSRKRSAPAPPVSEIRRVKVTRTHNIVHESLIDSSIVECEKTQEIKQSKQCEVSPNSWFGGWCIIL